MGTKFRQAPETMELTRGQQIIYIPSHVYPRQGEESPPLYHPDCEKGFVTSVNGHGYAFCRYWSKYPPFNLRTQANSERTPIANLVVQDTVPQIAVEAALEEYGRKVE